MFGLGLTLPGAAIRRRPDLAAPAGTLRAITARTGMASERLANSNSSTQIQTQQHYHVLRSASDLQLVLGNFDRSAANGPYLCAVGRTLNVGVSKSPTGPFLALTFGGSKTLRMPASDGTLYRSDVVAMDLTGGPWTSGDSLFVRINDVWDSAPANWPQNKTLSTTSYDFNRTSTDNSLPNLTEATGAHPAVRTLAGGSKQPIVGILGTGAHPVVWLCNDSIGSEAVSDTALPYYFGFTQQGLARAGLPFCNTGVTGQGLSSLLTGNGGANFAKYLEIAQANGATHMLYTALGSDFAGGQTGAGAYGNLAQLKSRCDAVGIRLIPITTTPKTNASNSGMFGSETVTDVQQPDLNARIRAGNGVGYGYVDVAALCCDANTNRWRLDRVRSTGVAVAAGGTGYAIGDDVDLDGGVQVRVSAVSGGAATGLSIRKVGAFVSAPASSLPQLFSNRGGLPAGTGLQVTVTTAALTMSDVSGDGVHPLNAYHSILAHDPTHGVAARAQGLFS